MIPFIVLPSGSRYIGTFDHHIRAYVDLSIVDFDSTLPPSFSASSSDPTSPTHHVWPPDKALGYLRYMHRVDQQPKPS